MIPASDIERPRARWDIVGAEVPLRRKGREFAGSCPFHAEKTPSFFVSPDKGFFHCFAGETLVPTLAGRQIGGMVGNRVELLTPAGWQPGFVNSFGRQELYELVLTRNGTERSVLTTQGHRWFVRGSKSAKRTADLSVGARLEATQMPKRSDWHLHQIGIAHGIVFGDGTAGTVNLHDGKADLVRHFWPFGIGGVRHDRGADHGYLRVYGGSLFDGFKNLPQADVPDDYALGFLAGWLATDGCVDDRGAVILSSADRGALQWARDIGLRLALETSPIRETLRTGYLDEARPMFSVEFRRSTFDPKMLLRARHRERFLAGNIAFERKRWTVAEVRPTGRVAEVYCAQVPEVHAFGLADDLLTGNCFGCGAHGTVIDFVMRLRGLSFINSVREILGLPAQPSAVAIPKRGAEPARDTAADVAEVLAGCEPITSATAAGLYLILRDLEPEQPALLAHPGLYCHELRRRLPALVAPIVNSEGQATAVQRIWLVDRVEFDGTRTATDNRAPLRDRKKTLGVMGDGAVQLRRPRDLPNNLGMLGLAEGIETAIAVRREFHLRCWATCGVARLGFPAHWRETPTPQGQRPVIWVPPDRPPTGARVVWCEERPPSVSVPDSVQHLVIFGDNGTVGRTIATHAADWYSRHGLPATVEFPAGQFDDFNDSLDLSDERAARLAPAIRAARRHERPRQ